MNPEDIEYLNAQPDGATVIETDRLKIKELVRKNANAVYRILLEINDPDAVFDETVPMKDIIKSEPEEVLGSLIAGNITDQYRFYGYGLWGVFFENNPIGLAMLKNGSSSGTAEIGYIISKEYRRRGLMTEAMLAVLDFAHDQGFESVEIRVNPDNRDSKAFFNRLRMLYRSGHGMPDFSENCSLRITHTAEVDSLSFTL